MKTAVKTRLVRIGNSQGVRIPKQMIAQVGLSGEVELEAQPGRLTVRPVPASRDGWEAQFRAMALAGDDRLLDDPIPPTKWESEEWEW